MLRPVSANIAWLAALSVALTACGTSTNFNQIFGRDETSGDSMVEQAKAAYDRGDFKESEKLATKLLDRNPDNEDAAIVLGYSYLSSGGIDPYNLARKLIALNTADQKTAASPTALADAEPSTNSNANDASGTLSQLGSLINLTDADFVELSDRKFSAEDNDTKEPKLFAGDNQLFVPAKISDALREKVAVLSSMNHAIKAVCRFVDESVKLTAADGDPRDSAADCAQTTGPRTSQAKAHFLWAFSHLTESLVYQSVLLYSGAKTGTSNFQVASSTLDVKTFSDFTEFTDDVSELKNATDAVFDTTNNDSMLRGTLNDLTTVTLAFDAIHGLPDGIKNRIVKALKSINEVGTALGGGAQNNAGALKGQMTEKLTKTVGTKVGTQIDQELAKLPGKPKTTAEVEKSTEIPQAAKDQVKAQVTKACGAYTTLSKGLPPEKIAANKPSTCP